MWGLGGELPQQDNGYKYRTVVGSCSQAAIFWGRLPCAKGAVSESDWGIVLPQYRYTRRPHGNFCWLRYWEYELPLCRILQQMQSVQHLSAHCRPHNAENRPVQLQICFRTVKVRNVSSKYLLPWKTDWIGTQKIIPKMSFFFCHFFSQLLCQWNQLLIMLWLHYNPSVTASPCHLPLHKGDFGAA